MASIKLKNLIKAYGATQVVKGINLEINPREFVVLVGPSGCGKTTTLRMIAGLEAVSGGEVWIDNKKVNDLAPKDRDIAMVFQNYALYPHMSVYENLSFALKLRRMSPQHINTRVKEVANILGLENFLDRKPAALSGGQRQRVAMGRAIVRHPIVFLFDEPLSNLDAKLRNQMRIEIKKIHLKMTATSVYVTHDQVEAMTLADRIVIMKDGVVQQVGKPLDIYQNPTNTFVAGFIGGPPTNFIELNGKYCGIRPEHLYLEKSKLKDNEQLNATVEFVETLGGESFVHSIVRDQKIVAKVAGTVTLQVGETVSFYIQKQDFKYFDKTTGVRI